MSDIHAGLSDKLAMRRIRSLNALQTFLVAARAGSFVRAADALSLTHGAISKQMAVLERELGVALFRREPNAVQLTDEGVRLRDQLAPVFDALDECLASLHLDPIARPLVISCEPTITAKILIPLLAELQPAFEIRTLAAGGAIDLRAKDVDIAIRRRDFAIDNGLVVHRLCDEAVGPVLSRQLVAQGVLDRLETVDVLVSRSRPDALAKWEERNGGGLRRRRVVSFDNHLMLVHAACAGHGLAMLSPLMADSELDSGVLTAPFGFTPDGTDYVALSRKPLAEGTPASQIVDAMRRRMQSISDRWLL